MKTTLDNYIKEQKRILRHLCVWNKLTELEQLSFETSHSEIQVDNYMRDFIIKYL